MRIEWRVAVLLVVEVLPTTAVADAPDAVAIICVSMTLVCPER